MSERVLYLLTVVAAGWLVTFLLRSLPFLLFAGRDRELPPWVERLGSIVSPVIIAGLIVYSYATLKYTVPAAGSETAAEVREAVVPAWKTCWPYLAGILTVGLQLWKRNPLVSIVAGTALYMLLISCGCTTHRSIEFDAQHPAVRVSVHGVLFGNTIVDPKKIPGLLEDYGVPKSAAIHILLDPEVRSMTIPGYVMATLSKAGYTRPILVTKRHSESVSVGKPKPAPKQTSATKSAPVKRRIRYRKANE